MLCGVIWQNTVSSSHREGFSSDVSWSVLTRAAPDLPEPDLPEPDLPDPVQGLRWLPELCRVYIEQIALLDERIGASRSRDTTGRAKTDEGNIAAHDHPRSRPDVCHDHSGLCAANGGIFKWA